MANYKSKDELNIIEDYGWQLFSKTGSIEAYGLIAGAREVRSQRQKDLEQEMEM